MYHEQGSATNAPCIGNCRHCLSRALGMRYERNRVALRTEPRESLKRLLLVGPQLEDLTTEMTIQNYGTPRRQSSLGGFL